VPRRIVGLRRRVSLPQPPFQARWIHEDEVGLRVAPPMASSGARFRPHRTLEL
jgi:hypothetical protein